MIVYQTMGKIEDIPSAKPWIGTIARNAAINRLRKNAATDKWRADIDDETVYTYTPDEAVSDPLEVVINEESAEQVYREMKTLGEIYENVLLLKYHYQFEVNEIAKMLQLNLNTTYSRLERGRCKLREKLINEKEGKKDEQKGEEYNGEKVRR